MARRRQKRRTHVPDAARQNPAPQNAINSKTAAPAIHASMSRTPKTMVIRAGAGQVGPSLTTLTRDLRRVMEPFTASRLQERRSNKLKDYITMAGPLGVTQLLLFSRSDENGNVNLRILRTPRGPTLHFRVLNYSLCRDVLKSQRKPKGASRKEFLNPPLLVMNNFMTNKSDEKPKNHEMLATSMFQSLFPAISAQKTPLAGIKRVLLLNRDPTAEAEAEAGEDGEKPFIVDLRHYSISTKPVGVPRTIRRLNRAVAGAPSSSAKQKINGKKDSFPNLGGLQDIADFMLDPAAAGYTSESEVETDAEVEVASTAATVIRKKSAKSDEANGENGVHTEKKAIKLNEMGPRLRLQLVKIDEGANEGKVLWHSYVKKTKAEERELDVRAKVKKELKEKRRKEQNENVQRKKDEKEAKKRKKIEGKEAAGKEREEGGAGGEEDDEDDELQRDAVWSGDEDIWSDVGDSEGENEDESGNEEEEDVEMEDD